MAFPRCWRAGHVSWHFGHSLDLLLWLVCETWHLMDFEGWQMLTHTLKTFNIHCPPCSLHFKMKPLKPSRTSSISMQTWHLLIQPGFWHHPGRRQPTRREAASEKLWSFQPSDQRGSIAIKHSKPKKYHTIPVASVKGKRKCWSPMRNEVGKRIPGLYAITLAPYPTLKQRNQNLVQLQPLVIHRWFGVSNHPTLGKFLTLPIGHLPLKPWNPWYSTQLTATPRKAHCDSKKAPTDFQVPGSCTRGFPPKNREPKVDMDEPLPLGLETLGIMG